MTQKKSNLKVYQGKSRIYRPVPGTVNIARLFIWSDEKGEYLPPERGKVYLARRYEAGIGSAKQRVAQYFETLEEARAWQAHVAPPASRGMSLEPPKTNPEPAKGSGPLFGAVVAEWKERKYPALASGSRVHYDQLLGHYFGSLHRTAINAITPSVVDAWIAGLKRTVGLTHQSRTRKSFIHELTLLGVILRYYGEYHEDSDFRYPVKKRHREDVKLKVVHDEKPKDLTVEEFTRFRAALLKGTHGQTLAALATVQYFEALRVSEAAALHWEDVALNLKAPAESRLRIVRHVEFSRKAGMQSKIAPGFKNSHATGGSKELPLFPEAFAALASLHQEGAKGLVFPAGEGRFFEYRQIQAAYNRAFKAAGLPYRSTHVMRHGGCRTVYNETGDLGLAAQILGNVSPDTVNVYAKRHKSALTNFAREKWKSDGSGAGWSQVVANPGGSSQEAEVEAV